MIKPCEGRLSRLRRIVAGRVFHGIELTGAIRLQDKGPFGQRKRVENKPLELVRVFAGRVDQFPVWIAILDLLVGDVEWQRITPCDEAVQEAAAKDMDRRA